MEKKYKKRVEKLAKVVGRRRPVAAFFLLFLGIGAMLSMLAYAPGQHIFFHDFFEPLINTTSDAGANVCGKFGATLSLASFAAFGAAAFMLPVYLLWSSYLCFRRSDTGVGKMNALLMLCGLLLFAIVTAAIFPESTGAYFPCGVGGKFGTSVYDSFLFPIFDKAGTLILAASLCFMCLVAVFVESPSETLAEIGDLIAKIPSATLATLKFVWKVLAFLPSLLINKLVERKMKASVSDIDNAILTPKQVAPTPQEASPAPTFARTSAPEIAEEHYNIDLNSIEVPDEPAPDPEKPDFNLEENQNSGRVLDFGEGEEELPHESTFTPKEIDLSPKEHEDNSHALDDFDIDESEPSREIPPASVEDIIPENSPEQTLGASFKVEKLEQEKYSAPKTQEKKGDYIFPTVELLQKAPQIEDDAREDYEGRIKEIVSIIGQFGSTVIPDKASAGPVITRYEVRPAPGVRVAKIANLEDDIAVGIRAEKVRIIAPIPGRGTVGIEVPNKIRQVVCLRDIIESKEWNESKAEIPIALGKDVTGKPMVVNLAKMPHLLIAGTTGSGKSVCVNTIIASLLYKTTPDDLRFIMVDPKVVELQIYNSLPHMLVPVVTDPTKVPATLRWLISEMDRRYKIFKCTEVRNITGFNAKILKDKQAQKLAEEMDASLSPEERAAAALNSAELALEDTEVEIPKEKLPYIVCIIDELADLMMTSGKEVETAIARLTQLARAAGIHLIVATQRPSTDVITGLIKSNLPTRIAFKVQSQVDSRTIIDKKGAETLIGYGDMLYYPGGDFIRAQCAFLKDEEIEAIVESIKVNGDPEYVEEIQAQIDAGDEDEKSDDDESDGDPMLGKAISEIRAAHKASTSFLQRRLGIGYGRAARIIDQLEQMGKIGPDKGPGTQRDIYLD